MKVVASGYLEYEVKKDGWEDGIRLVDEGRPGQCGWMPLVMDCFKPLAGKSVRITIETVDWDTGEPTEL